MSERMSSGKEDKKPKDNKNKRNIALAAITSLGVAAAVAPSILKSTRAENGLPKHRVTPERSAPQAPGEKSPAEEQADAVQGINKQGLKEDAAEWDEDQTEIDAAKEKEEAERETGAREETQLPKPDETGEQTKGFE